MQLRLGDATYDLTSRALYAAPLSADSGLANQVIAAAAAGADMVSVSAVPAALAQAVQDAVALTSLPVAARSAGVPDAAERAAVLQSGAALWLDDFERLTPAILEDLARADVSLAVEQSAGPQARAAGLASFVAPGDGPGRLGFQVAAMMAGSRIIETSDVREARRVGVTVSEMLERRSLTS